MAQRDSKISCAQFIQAISGNIQRVSACHEVGSSRHANPQGLRQEICHIQPCVGANGILCEVQESHQVIAKHLRGTNETSRPRAEETKDLEWIGIWLEGIKNSGVNECICDRMLRHFTS